MSKDFLPIAKYQLPDDWSPEGTVCVKITIPNDQQYFGQLIGLLDTLKWSKNFSTDETRTGAATVSRTWQRALESAPVKIEGCDMPDFRINPETCLLEYDCGDGDWKVIITPVTDPRTDIPYDPPYPDPPPEGQSNECLAAANVAEVVWFMGGKFALQLNDGGLFAEFLALVMSVISAMFQLTLELIFSATNAIFIDIDPETIGGDWTALDRQDFIDLLVCYIEPDGTITPANWALFLGDLLALVPSNQAWQLVHYCCLLIGYGGVNLAPLVGAITEAECASCEADEWIVTYDAGGLDYTFQTQGVLGSGEGIGGTNAGRGTVHVYGSDNVQGVITKVVPVAAGTLTDITLWFSMTPPVGNTAPQACNVQVRTSADVLKYDSTNAIPGDVSAWTEFTPVSGVSWDIDLGDYILIDVNMNWFGYAALAAESIVLSDNIAIQGSEGLF